MNPLKALDDMRTIKQLLTDAERIAREMGEEEPGAEHLLLSSISLPDGTAARAAARVGVDADRIRAALREEQAEALVAAGVPRDRAEAMANPTPLGAAGAPILYGAGPTAREVFQEAGKLARSSKQRLAGAHVVAAVAGLERGTMPRVLDRLGVDGQQLADAARAELAARYANRCGTLIPMDTAGGAKRRDRFRQLHERGTFVMPNPWDIGSARILASMRFPALATTSLGHAASLGKVDQTVTRDELLTHVATIAAAVDLPLNVDAERCFANDPAGVAETVTLLAEAGAAGCSIEDYDPARGSIDDITVAAERVASAADAAHRHGMLLTARAENALYGIDDIDDTIGRLRAYRDAGADVLYAPRLTDPEQIRRVVQATDAPVNVLAMRHGPSVPELAELGVRRVSTGGPLARAAYGALRRAAEELLGPGTSTYQDDALSSDDLDRAFGDRR